MSRFEFEREYAYREMNGNEMMVTTADMVGKLRATTGAPLMKCKTALVAAEGNMEQALPILRRIAEVVTVPMELASTQGYVAVYTHQDNQVVALVELVCDTDFVARSDEFRSVANELAMQVAASAPVAISPRDVPG
ncbi:MAG: hypothetical protein EOO38_22120, partial [Cytophagaceae bacterium]